MTFLQHNTRGLAATGTKGPEYEAAHGTLKGECFDGFKVVLISHLLMLRLVTDKLRSHNFDILCELEFATHPDTLLQWLAAAVNCP
jgi:hypothetical protein